MNTVLLQLVSSMTLIALIVLDIVGSLDRWLSQGPRWSSHEVRCYQAGNQFLPVQAEGKKSKWHDGLGVSPMIRSEMIWHDYWLQQHTETNLLHLWIEQNYIDIIARRKIHNIDVGQECGFSRVFEALVSCFASCRNTGGTGPAGVDGTLLGREQHGDACSRSGLSSTLALAVHEAKDGIWNSNDILWYVVMCSIVEHYLVEAGQRQWGVKNLWSGGFWRNRSWFQSMQEPSSGVSVTVSDSSICLRKAWLPQPRCFMHCGMMQSPSQLIAITQVDLHLMPDCQGQLSWKDGKVY